MNTTESESEEDKMLKRMAAFLADPILMHAERIYDAIPFINVIIGLPGSLVSFIVIMRMKPFTSASFYYCVLAVADGFFVSYVVFMTHAGMISSVLMDTLCPIAEGVWEIFTLFPNFILIVLAGERGIAVWFPLKVSVFTSVSKAIVCCIACFVIVLALTLHNFAVWRMDEVGFCAMYGIEGYFEFFKKVWSKVMPFLYSVVPCILLVLLNIIIISGLSRSNRIRQHIAEGDKKTKKETATQTKQVTLMLLSISILFLITNIPYAIFHVFGNIGGWYVAVDDVEHLFTLKHLNYNMMSTFFTMWRDLNHSLNFICYFFSTRRFRQEFKKLFSNNKKTLTCCYMMTTKAARVTSDASMSDNTGRTTKAARVTSDASMSDNTGHTTKTTRVTSDASMSDQTGSYP